MNISKDTISILQNFASVNSNILIQSGNVIKTISVAKNILASAEIAETFPREFGIYDLNEFLSVFDLIEDASLDFGDKSVVLSNKNQSVEYHYSAPELITHPSKDVKMPSSEVEVNLSQSVLSKIKKAASVLGHSNLIIQGDNGEVRLIVGDPNNKSSNTFDIILDSDNPCKEKFSFVLLINNLKLLNGDYKVVFSSKFISNFINQNVPLQYWIALEKNSSYGE